MKNSGKYVSVQLLNILLVYALSNNYDPDTLLQSAGIGAEILKDKDTRIDIEKFCSVVSTLTGMSGGGLTGLHLAQKINNIYSKNHILMTIMSNCPNLEKAIEKLIEYHDISSNYLKLHLEKNAGFTTLTWKSDIHIQPQLDWIFLEAGMVSCAIMFHDFTVGKVKFMEIHFSHSGPDDHSEYQSVLGCPVIFNSKENKIVFSNRDLLLPIALSDPELLGLLELYAKKILTKGETENSLSGRITTSLCEMILQGKDYNISALAKEMAVGVRTLQKQLKVENTSYRTLLEQVKKTIAVKNLENLELPFTDIAFLLGFSEQSAFNHAFKGWTGLSPSEYRSQFIG